MSTCCKLFAVRAAAPDSRAVTSLFALKSESCARVCGAAQLLTHCAFARFCDERASKYERTISTYYITTAYDLQYIAYSLYAPRSYSHIRTRGRPSPPPSHERSATRRRQAQAERSWGGCLCTRCVCERGGRRARARGPAAHQAVTAGAAPSRACERSQSAPRTARAHRLSCGLRPEA